MPRRAETIETDKGVLGKVPRKVYWGACGRSVSLVEVACRVSSVAGTGEEMV